MQSGSLSRAKGTQGSEGLEALLENGGEGQESGEGFQNFLSMLTMGQGQEQAPADSGEVTKSDVPNSDAAMSQMLASLNLNAADLNVGKNTEAPAMSGRPQMMAKMPQTTHKTNEAQANGKQSLQGLPFEKVSAKKSENSFENLGLDLQKILANSNVKVPNAQTKASSVGNVPVATEASVTDPSEEDAIQLSMMKRGVDQSPIVPNKLTPKTRGLLTGGDFVGLKTGFEQNQFESSRQSLNQDLKRPIPSSYQSEQTKMMNGLTAKKQTGLEDGLSTSSNKSADTLPAAGMMSEKDANIQRFENTLNTLNMKGQVDLKAHSSALDPKVQDVMGKISDYIVQAKFDKNNSLDVTLRHNDIGQFQMKVTKGLNGSGLDIAIRPHSIQSEKFFTDNQQSLIKGLNASGLKIADFKVSTSTFSGGQSFGESKSDNSSGQFGNARSGSQHFQSNSNNSEQQDSERRRQLWEQARERLETQYA